MKISRLRNWIAVLALASSACAQTKTVPVDFSKPKNHFPNLFGPYLPREVKSPSFENSTRIQDL